jgi:hypothetical protein
MAASKELALELSAWGTARADLAEAATLRKQLPPWAPDGAPGHFLKHADEQTIVAVTAVDRAIRGHGLDVRELRDWSIVAAPRFIGRLAGVATLLRFSRGGGPAISPHVIPQHSLHSVSGALSILLASRRPNLGVGGGADSLAEGLLAALSLPRSQELTGMWLIATAWDPEPVIDSQGNCLNNPVCFAAALALQSAANGSSLGRLQLETLDSHSAAAARDKAPLIGVPQLSRSLDSLSSGFGRGVLRWPVPGGAELVLHIDAAKAELSAAA